MIIKWFTSSPDPTIALRRRSRIAIGVFALGLIGTLCSRFFLSESVLPEFAHGFYSGASCGIMLVGAIFFARCRWLLRHPQKAKAQIVRENDEREKLILQKSMSAGWIVIYFLLAAALLITAPLNRIVFRTLFCVFIASFFVLTAARAFYARRL